MIDPRSSAEAETQAAADDISAQIANLRADLAKLTESVSALGTGAKNLAAEEAGLIVERARERVREEPLLAIAVTAGVAYVLGLLARR